MRDEYVFGKGMAIGMSFGLMVGAIFSSLFCPDEMSSFISGGMLAGVFGGIGYDAWKVRK